LVLDTPAELALSNETLDVVVKRLIAKGSSTAHLGRPPHPANATRHPCLTAIAMSLLRTSANVFCIRRVGSGGGIAWEVRVAACDISVFDQGVTP